MIAALLVAAALGAPPELTVALEPDEARVGDRVSATIAVRLPAGATGPPRFPTWEGGWGGAEVLASSAPVEDAGVWRQRLVLAFFAPGEQTLPAPVVEVPTSATPLPARPGRPLVVRVRSVLAPGQTEPEPAAPPRSLPVGRPFVWTAGGLAAAIAAAAILTRWRPRGRAATREAGALPPLEELRRALAGLSGHAAPEAAWVGLSLALRRYLGARLDFRATESTTSEIQRALLRGRLPADLAGETIRLLRAADQVKFARETVTATGVSTHVAAALEVAERVEALIQPPAAEAEAA